MIYHEDSQLTIHNGDALTELQTMAAESVQCCVTSPPYYGLRDYGVDGQIGLEETPELFIARLVDVFREVRRVLKDDGVCFINIGDSYFGSACVGAQPKDTIGAESARKQKTRAMFCNACGCPFVGISSQRFCSDACGGRDNTPRSVKYGLKLKDLIGIPWMLAFALRADGWYLRSEIIWHKLNPMPESVTDRPTKAHEQVFLLSKSPKYFYNADAVKEPCSPANVADFKNRKTMDNKSNGVGSYEEARPDLCRSREAYMPGDFLRNRRSVWSIASAPYSAAHFATFPPALIEPCILAGSRPAGKRCDCAEVIATPTGEGEITDPTMNTGRAGMNRPRRPNEGTRPITRRVQRGEAEQMKQSSNREQMREICGLAFDHYIRTDTSGARPLPESIRQDFLARGWLVAVRHCECPIEAADVVLDPFGGSGTTAQVANKFGRKVVLIELNPEYCELEMKRNCQKTLFAGAEV